MEQLSSIKHAISAGLSVIVSVSLVCAVLVPSANAEESAPVNAEQPNISNVADKIFYDARSRVPSVESTIGVGALPTDPKGTVALAGMNGYDAALVRVSVFAAKQDAQVLAAGVPALDVVKGHDASQTVLVPVVNGAVPLYATAQVDARVEVVSVFKSDANTPGATNALAAPAARADAVRDIGKKPFTVGVTGEGGVPSQHVRAAYVTAVFDAKAASKVTLDDQQFTVPQGDSVISTIVTPDTADGGIAVSADKTLNTVSLSVRGWVTGTAQNAAKANVEGSFVPAADAKWAQAKVQAGADSSIRIPGVHGRAMSLALVSASASGETEDNHTFVNVGKSESGRSSGIVVDRSRGALPQLELVESGDDRAVLSARNGDTEVRALPLGGIVGSPSAERGGASVSITTPQAGARIDLAQTGGVELAGDIASDEAIDSVKLYAGNAYLGNASVDYDARGAHWSATVGTPKNGDVKYHVEALSRDGASSAADVTVNTTIPSSDETVLAPGARIVDFTGEQIDEGQKSRSSMMMRSTRASDDGYIDPRLRFVDGRKIVGINDEGTMTFSAPPLLMVGNVISMTVNKKFAPQGKLVKITSITQNANNKKYWDVHTVQATMLEAIMQTGFSHDLLKPVRPGSTSGVSCDGAEGVTDVCDKDGASDISLISGVDVSSDTVASMGFKIHKSYSHKTNNTIVDTSKANKGNEAKIKSEVDTDLSATFDASEQMGVRFDLVIHCDWWSLDVSLQHFKTSLFGNMNAALDIEANGELKASYERELLKLSGVAVPFGIPVGPIVFPVVITTDFTATFLSDIDLTAAIKYAPKWEMGFEVGIEFKDGNWNRINTSTPTVDKKEVNKCGVWPSGLSGNAALKGGAGIRFESSVKLYDVLGPVATGEIRGNLDASLGVDDTGSANGNISFYVISSLGAALEAKIPVIKAGFRHQFAEIYIPDNKDAQGNQIGYKVFDYHNDECLPNLGTVKVTWHDTTLNGGNEHTESLATGYQLTIDRDYVAKRLGVDRSWFDDMTGVNTEANGQGETIKVGEKYTIPDHDVDLYVTHSTLGKLTKVKDVVTSGFNYIRTSNGVQYYLSRGSHFAIDDHGALWSWGSDPGLLGGPSVTGQLKPTLVQGLIDVKSIASLDVETSAYDTIYDSDYQGWNTSMFAVTGDGSLWSWGSNKNNQLGQGFVARTNTPKKVSGIWNVKSVKTFSGSVDDALVAAVTKDGFVYIWGNLAKDYFGGGNSNVPRRVDGLDRVVSIEIVGDYADPVIFAMRDDGSVWSFGYKGVEDLIGRSDSGEPSGSFKTIVKPKPLKNIQHVKTLQHTQGGVYALLEDGSVWVWGGGRDPQLIKQLSSITSISGPSEELSAPIEVSDGNVVSPYIFAVDKDGSVWVDYENNGFQNIQKISSLSNIESIYYGRYAVGKDGSLWSWGYDDYLHFANPDLPLSKLGSVTPKKISGIPSVKKIVTNTIGMASLAITRNGELWGWGAAGNPSLLDGTDAPVKISE